MLTYIVDDEPISLFLTEQVLRIEGFTSKVCSFAAADEALRVLLAGLPQEMPEIVLLDLNMPVTTGWDFLEALKPHAATLAGRCRIFILTSSLALADTVRAEQYALVAGIIHKPLDEADVLRMQQTPASATA